MAPIGLPGTVANIQKYVNVCIAPFFAGAKPVRRLKAWNNGEKVNIWQTETIRLTVVGLGNLISFANTEAGEPDSSRTIG